jgi:hypothetical protein
MPIKVRAILRRGSLSASLAAALGPGTRKGDEPRGRSFTVYPICNISQKSSKKAPAYTPAWERTETSELARDDQQARASGGG